MKKGRGILRKLKDYLLVIIILSLVLLNHYFNIDFFTADYKPYFISALSFIGFFWGILVITPVIDLFENAKKKELSDLTKKMEEALEKVKLEPDYSKKSSIFNTLSILSDKANSIEKLKLWKYLLIATLSTLIGLIMVVLDFSVIPYYAFILFCLFWSSVYSLLIIILGLGIVYLNR